MKRVILTCLAAILCLSALLSTTGCSMLFNPIDSFAEELENAESYEIVMLIEIEGIRIVMTEKVDGNITYTTYSNDMYPAEYTKTVDDYEIVYTEAKDGCWIKSITDGDDEEDEDSWLDDDIWDSENYEKVEGEKNTYRQKSDVIFEHLEDVVLTVNDGTVMFKAKVYYEGASADMKVTISKLNEIELELPSADKVIDEEDIDRK